jgi:hypothetical protein
MMRHVSMLLGMVIWTYLNMHIKMVPHGTKIHLIVLFLLDVGRY